MIFYTLLLLLFSSLACAYWYTYNRRQKYAHIKSPATLTPYFYHYIYGHVTSIQKLFTDNKLWIFGNIIDHLFLSCKSKTMVLHFYHHSRVFTTDLNIVPGILSDHANFKKSKQMHKSFSQLAGVRTFGPNGILNNPGDDVWQIKRKIMDNAFHKKYLRITFDDMKFVTDKVIDYIRENASEDKTIDMYPIFGKTALEIVSRAGFSIEEDVVTVADSPLLKAVHLMTSIMGLSFRNSWTFNLPWKFRKEKQDLRNYLGALRKYLRKHVQQRMDNEDGKGGVDDILSYIIKANTFDVQFTVDDIVDEFLTFFAAGMETTANSMTFFIYNIMKTPAVYRTLKEEVDKVIESSEDVTFEQINALVYLEQAIKESMRIKPAVLSTGRQAQSDVSVNGVFFPKDCWISVPQWLIQLDPEHWGPDSHTFDPDRFATGKSLTPFTYMPFMAGPRSCIGRNFAMLEMKIVLSMLIKNFDFIDPEPDNDVLPLSSDVTVKPKHGLPVIVKTR